MAWLASGPAASRAGSPGITWEIANVRPRSPNSIRPRKATRLRTYWAIADANAVAYSPGLATDTSWQGGRYGSSRHFAPTPSWCGGGDRRPFPRPRGGTSPRPGARANARRDPGAVLSRPETRGSGRRSHDPRRPTGTGRGTAHPRDGAGPERRRAAGAERPGRALAGQHARALQSSERHESGSARSQLQRLRRPDDRRGRSVPLQDHQARRLSGDSHLDAAAPPSLRGDRPGQSRDHPDVFSG